MGFDEIEEHAVGIPPGGAGVEQSESSDFALFFNGDSEFDVVSIGTSVWDSGVVGKSCDRLEEGVDEDVEEERG